MTKNKPSTRELARMRAQGMTQAQIGAKYGVSHTAIWQWIEKDRAHFNQLICIFTRKLERQAEERKARAIAELEAEI